MAGETNRRAFMFETAAGAVIALDPTVVFGTGSNSKIELGLIGCGGRGNWIAMLFNDTGKYRFVACADYFSGVIIRGRKSYKGGEVTWSSLMQSQTRLRPDLRDLKS